MKELEWGSSSGPPPIVLENFIKVDTFKISEPQAAKYTVTLYYDPLDRIMWKAEQYSFDWCNWYISSESLR